MPFGTADGATEAILILTAASIVLIGLLFWVWRNVTADAGTFPEAETESATETPHATVHRYYWFDDDFFRARTGDTSVSDVLRAGQWVTYKGDLLEPVVLGKQIGANAIPGRAGKIAELLQTRSKIQRQIEIVRTIKPRTPDIAVVTDELKEMLVGIDQRLSKLQPGTDGPPNQAIAGQQTQFPTELRRVIPQLPRLP